MKTSTCDTYKIQLYLAGPIEIAKQLVREYCFSEGLCVTITPTTYIYTGGEEIGYIVEFINYPRFPVDKTKIESQAELLLKRLIEDTFQKSGTLVTPTKSVYYSNYEGR